MKMKGLFRDSLKKKINLILTSKKNREEILEEIEELLILSDISVDLVDKILAKIRSQTKLTFEKDDFLELLKNELKTIFSQIEDSGVRLPEDKNIILLVGINGSGKTTTAAKLARYFSLRGKRVMCAAADTFRAAGSSQLVLWGERLGIPVISGEKGADPGSVVYNSIQAFNSRDVDLLIVDTAGRVQTRDNLMKELNKITKIVQKFYPSQPAETLLVIDATMGQNTLDQASKFKAFSGISGIVLAKIDGSAKGGTVVNILDEMKIPVKFAGVGETENDLIEFSADDFIDSLLYD